MKTNNKNSPEGIELSTINVLTECHTIIEGDAMSVPETPISLEEVLHETLLLLFGINSDPESNAPPSTLSPSGR